MSAAGFPVPLKGPSFLAISVKELLQADPTLQAIFGSNFYRRNLISEEPNFGGYPCAVIVPVSVSQHGKASQRIVTTVEIGMLVCFSAFNVNLQTAIGADDAGTSDLLLYMLNLVRGDLVSAYARNRFQQLAPVLQLVTYEDFRELKPEPIFEKGKQIAMCFGIIATYIYKAELFGRQVVGQIAA